MYIYTRTVFSKTPKVIVFEDSCIFYSRTIVTLARTHIIWIRFNRRNYYFNRCYKLISIYKVPFLTLFLKIFSIWPHESPSGIRHDDSCW